MPTRIECEKGSFFRGSPGFSRPDCDNFVAQRFVTLSEIMSVNQIENEELDLGQDRSLTSHRELPLAKLESFFHLNRVTLSLPETTRELVKFDY